MGKQGGPIGGAGPMLSQQRLIAGFVLLAAGVYQPAVGYQRYEGMGEAGQALGEFPGNRPEIIAYAVNDELRAHRVAGRSLGYEEEIEVGVGVFAFRHE